ncbi:MAG: hypothetical protein K1X28_09340 [Parachlamydiales bacterium]|nr:hypothetical protein [Parachlamydiales bacterium]
MSASLWADDTSAVDASQDEQQELPAEELTVPQEQTERMQDAGICCPSCRKEPTYVLIEATGAYFLPTNDIYKKIYSHGSGIYGLEMSVHAWQELYAWTSVSYFSKGGRSIGEGDKTELKLVPIGVGLKYFFPIGCWDIYLSGGILASYLHLHDYSPFVIQSNSKWTVGGTGKIGVLWNLAQYFFIDAFSSYSYMKFDFDSTHGGKIVPHDVNLSGWSFGGAFGFRF